MNLSLLRRHDDMVENLKSKHYQVCDTRPESDYKGQSTGTYDVILMIRNQVHHLNVCNVAKCWPF